MAKKIVWFARGGGIAKSGPFKTQALAAKSMRLVAPTPVYGQPLITKLFPDDVFVWPEEI